MGATGGTLTRGIRSLGRADLEVLLTRRPEAAAAIGLHGQPPTVALLASALAGRSGVRRAVESLDHFLLQLLRVAAWMGSEVTGADLEAQAAGVDPAELRAGASELARWGLAFPHEAPAGWGLWVPGAVRAEVPPALGRRAAELLAGEPAESLRSMLLRLGVQAPRPATRDALMTLLTDRLGDPACLAGALARAPEAASTVLQAFVDAGGMLTWEAMPRHGVRFGIPSAPGDDSGTGVAWLRQMGLLVVTAASPWHLGAGLSIPGEAQLALRQGVVFRDWEPRPPQVETGPLPAGVGAAGDAAGLLSGVQALLDEWAHRPPRAVQKGGAGVRDIRKVARAIGVEERHGQFLYAVAAEAQLLEYRDDVIVPSETGERWGRQPSPVQWTVLFDAWVGSRLWREPVGLVPIEEAAHDAGVERRRRSVLQVLGELPGGRGADPRGIARLLWWRQPLLARTEHGLEEFVEGVGEALAWLGSGTGGPLVSLLEPARSALTDPGWVASPEAAALFPEPVSTLRVQPDLTVMVPGRPTPELSRALSCFAELQASSPARIYRISESSLRGALDAGMGADRIMGLLDRHARGAVPQAVAYLVEDVGRQHGRLVAGRGGLFVRSEDPSIVAAVVADRRLAKLRPRSLAPTVAVFAETDIDRLLKALRAAGYMPVRERTPDPGRDEGDVDIGWRITRRPDGSPVVHRHPDRGRRGGPGAVQVRRIAAAVAEDAARPGGPATVAPVADSLMDGRLCRIPREIRRLVELGVQHSAAIEIQYLSGMGETTQRVIEPLESDRSSVTARCRLRGDERTFWISRIRWARATGEHFEPDSYHAAQAHVPPFGRRRAR